MLICSRCKKEYPDEYSRYRCICGYCLEYKHNKEKIFSKTNIVTHDWTIWRYKNYLPVNERFKISLGEGLTPLVKIPWLNHNIYFKLDYLCPTGSFKDRGISVLVSKLKEMNVNNIIEDSSGNAGAAMAAYCANANTSCTIFVPQNTSLGKINQIMMYGAKINKVPGSREDTYIETEKAAEIVYYASHNWSPYFLEGVETLYYELWEQFDENMPDNIIVPVGQGSIVLSFELALRKILKERPIRLPKIFAIQAKNCAPLYHAFKNDFKKSKMVEKRDTIAEGIATIKPVRGEEVVNIIRKSKGAVIAVEEKEIWEGLKLAAGKGIFIEPTSAVSIAGMH